MQRLFGKGQSLRYLCQDETRLGLKTIPGRLITATGVKPHGPSQWKRKCFWVYGAVEPLSGFHFFYEFSHLDSDCFQRFINLLSITLGETSAVLQMDRGAFHRSETLDWPENLIPIFQPAHCPELNPIERLWQWLKAQLKWENYSSLEELRKYFGEFVEQLREETVASLTSYEFILEALFRAAS